MLFTFSGCGWPEACNLSHRLSDDGRDRSAGKDQGKPLASGPNLSPLNAGFRAC